MLDHEVADRRRRVQVQAARVWAERTALPIDLSPNRYTNSVNPSRFERTVFSYQLEGMEECAWERDGFVVPSARNGFTDARMFARIAGVISGVPDLTGELGLGLWLLIRGTRRPRAVVRPDVFSASSLSVAAR